MPRSAPVREVRRVQRPLDDLPILHLEVEVPSRMDLAVAVDGLVETPATFPLEMIRSMPSIERVWDLHCVWGWSRAGCRWEGIPASTLLDASGPLPRARHVVARAIDGPYASCFTLEEARAGLLAWRLDGEELTPEHGGPLRLVAPPSKWGYKSVKWLGGFTLVEEFTPGFWEELVGNARGDVPAEMLDLAHE
jgi:DMSO/TMAO reductase YedYZ molybdopterin-dependent catalytic subunit